MLPEADVTHATLESAPTLYHSLSRRLIATARSPRHRVVNGSVVLLTGLGLATVINFIYNIAVARFLGPVAFGHTTAVYTLLILVSAVTLSIQILTAKIVAQQGSAEAQTLVYRGFHVRGWAAGITVSVLLLLFRNTVTGYLKLPDSILIILLAIGTTFYVPLGARRGYLQGVCNFSSLAFSLILESLCRFCGSLLAIHSGFGVTGVVAANATAVALAYFFARPKLSETNELTPDVPVAFRESLQASVFFAGQVIINNCDIVVVKHFFPPESAGVYAAVAMVGRVVFVLSWAVVNSMFPIAAAARSRKQDDQGVLSAALLLVSGICTALLLALRLAPASVWTHLFGSQFGHLGGSDIRSLLVLYAFCAAVYCLSVVLIAYEMSHKIANTGWVQLVISGAVIAGIYRFHSSLVQVIWVQVAMMAVLLFWVAIPFVIPAVVGAGTKADDESGQAPGSIKLGRPVSENDVIAEFLKNDLRSGRFDQYQNLLDKVVVVPDLQDTRQNDIRRALFNVRHRSLWSELPDDTQWFSAEIQPDDLHRIRAFPRAQWRKLAHGDFRITEVAPRIFDDDYRHRTPKIFRDKIDSLRSQLKQDADPGAVLLIGRTENGPFTILDGNHRLAAAMLTSPEAVRRLRFFCGLSHRMHQCCWYRTDVMSLLRYGTNMIRHFVHDPEKELCRLLRRKDTNGAPSLQPHVEEEGQLR